MALIDDTHMRPTRLLIEPERQHDAPRRRPALADERLQHVHDADEPALVVRRAAAPDALAVEVAGVRRMDPGGDSVGGDGDNVCVRVLDMEWGEGGEGLQGEGREGNVWEVLTLMRGEENGLEGGVAAGPRVNETEGVHGRARELRVPASRQYAKKPKPLPTHTKGYCFCRYSWNS